MLTKQLLPIATLLLGSLWRATLPSAPEASFCLRAAELNILFPEAYDPDLLDAGTFLLFRNQLKHLLFRDSFPVRELKRHLLSLQLF